MTSPPSIGSERAKGKESLGSNESKKKKYFKIILLQEPPLVLNLVSKVHYKVKKLFSKQKWQWQDGGLMLTYHLMLLVQNIIKDRKSTR